VREESARAAYLEESADAPFRERVVFFED